MRGHRRKPWTYVVAAFVVGALVGGVFAAVTLSADGDAKRIAELRDVVSTERRARRAAQERVRSVERRLDQLAARIERFAAEPMTIHARGFEPLIGLEGVGRMLYRCAGEGMKLALVEDQMSATADVSYAIPGLPPLSRTLHPGKRIVTPVVTGESSWTIVQATEPKTVTATVEIGPPAGPCYLAPATNATIRSESHDTSVEAAD